MKEKMKNQQPMQPTNLTQNFQLAPTNREVIRYANSIEDVQKDNIVGEYYLVYNENNKLVYNVNVNKCSNVVIDAYSGNIIDSFLFNCVYT